MSKLTSQELKVLETLYKWDPELQKHIEPNKESLVNYWRNPSEANEASLQEKFGIEDTFFNKPMVLFDDYESVELSDEYFLQRSECEKAVVEFTIDFLSLLISAFGASVPRSVKKSATLINRILQVSSKIYDFILKLVNEKSVSKKVENLYEILKILIKENILSTLFDIIKNEMGPIEKIWFAAKVAGTILLGVLSGGGLLAVKIAMLIADGIDSIRSAIKVSEKCC
ncbi:hypothetical protein [uncultured Kordia sp.]|uniref:hypothetical protein n=1 Tax=uncultured Kordia sp. TaxID=507699 RepID=UPI00261EFE7A|nr:hypothetical protein [uncultured Kordia sp.]